MNEKKYCRRWAAECAHGAAAAAAYSTEAVVAAGNFI
jgi:hypothetical protein